LYPLFLKLDGSSALVVGAGAIASHKAEALLACGAEVTLVAPRIGHEVAELVSREEVILQRRGFSPADVDGKRLVIAATDDPEVNESVMQHCRTRGVLVNVVDDPARCDFFVPSVIRRGRVQVAISTGGASPALARKLKGDIAGVLEPTLGEFVELVCSARERIKQILADAGYEQRRRANEQVLASEARRRLAQGDEPGARRAVEEVLASLRQGKDV